MLSLVVPREPEIVLEPVVEIAGRSWQKFLRGQYHDQRDAPPMVEPAEPIRRDDLADDVRAIRAGKKAAQEARLLALIGDPPPTFDALHTRSGWTYDVTRRVLMRLMKAGTVERDGINSRWDPPVYRRRRITPQE